ncbi:PH domain-containing protein [Bacillus horti]|uniref:Uncharacterized protein YyaB-like PH domain-containing protein n=1 Tax=Caldalkalibacillus horti TaxID=77523 RepID=A0ABT9VZ16_9BACI|nr:PH domain-containing protein [Bacillus horti]MDQ0166243.1 hypothetical protein [Bacillus horti]
MIFRAERDSFFTKFIWICVLLILAACFLPLLFPLADGEKLPIEALVILTIVAIGTVVPILWMSYSLEYRFAADHLFIKAGPIRKRIPYTEITNVEPTRDIYTGFRLLSARNALEVSYSSAVFGGVKISPEKKELFLAELTKHCPDVTIKME